MEIIITAVLTSISTIILYPILSKAVIGFIGYLFKEVLLPKLDRNCIIVGASWRPAVYLVGVVEAQLPDHCVLSVYRNSLTRDYISALKDKVLIPAVFADLSSSAEDRSSGYKSKLFMIFTHETYHALKSILFKDNALDNAFKVVRIDSRIALDYMEVMKYGVTLKSS